MGVPGRVGGEVSSLVRVSLGLGPVRPGHLPNGPSVSPDVEAGPPTLPPVGGSLTPRFTCPHRLGVLPSHSLYTLLTLFRDDPGK